MSLLAVVYHLVPEAPILVACNRDEMFDRPCPAPSIQSGKPRVLASIDPNSNGTYLGIWNLVNMTERISSSLILSVAGSFIPTAKTPFRNSSVA